MTERSPHLPVEPLVRAAGCRDDLDFARRLGYATLTEMNYAVGWYRMKREGLSELHADQYACAVGLHPADVWGDDWWAVVAWWNDRPHLTTPRHKRRPRREPRWGLIAAELVGSEQ